MVTFIDDDDIELKPCPFCGSTAGLYASYEGMYRPIVFLTSNNYRELSQPMLRRCSYLYIEHKPLAEIKQIICANVSASEVFVDSVAQVIDRLQSLDLRHAISISEGIEWAKCLIETFHCKTAMDVKNAMPYSIGSLVKDHADEKTVAKAFNLSNGNEK